jgi:hypothetical protein
MHTDNQFDRRVGALRLYVAETARRNPEHGFVDYNVDWIYPIYQTSTKTWWKWAPVMAPCGKLRQSTVFKVANDESPRDVILAWARRLNSAVRVQISEQTYANRRLVQEEPVCLN